MDIGLNVGNLLNSQFTSGPQARTLSRHSTVRPGDPHGGDGLYKRRAAANTRSKQSETAAKGRSSNSRASLYICMYNRFVWG